VELRFGVTRTRHSCFARTTSQHETSIYFMVPEGLHSPTDQHPVTTLLVMILSFVPPK
jgi:hypothetical protein